MGLASQSGTAFDVAGRRELGTALRGAARKPFRHRHTVETTTVGRANTRRRSKMRSCASVRKRWQRDAALECCHIELQFDQEGVVLRIHDDGCGFDVPDTIATMNGHYGLISMQERAEDIEARFSIVSVKGTGTDVEVIVPLSADEAQLVSES